MQNCINPDKITVDISKSHLKIFRQEMFLTYCHYSSLTIIITHRAADFQIFFRLSFKIGFGLTGKQFYICVAKLHVTSIIVNTTENRK